MNFASEDVETSNNILICDYFKVIQVKLRKKNKSKKKKGDKKYEG